MTSQDLDRMLGDDASVEPSAAFNARVMRAVRADASTHGTDRFAWKSWWPVLATASTAVPLMIAAQAMPGIPVANLPLPLEQLLAVTLAGTLSASAWCLGLLREA